jgi:D-glycero-D-manno-heptose 1,7-bisphosphate phosphatase
MRRAVFFDRDGTLNEDPGYLSDPDQLRLLPGAGQALARLAKAGFQIFVVTNQSGVGRGKFKREALDRVHERFESLLARDGARVDDYGICEHAPEMDCECRKPKPKLILDLCRQHGLNPRDCYMVGDKASDLEAGRAAGCSESILVLTGDGAKVTSRPPATVASIAEAADWILARSK